MQLAEAFVDIKGRDSLLQASFARAQMATQAFVNTTNMSLGKIGALLGVGAAAFGLKHMFDAAAASEESLARLRLALTTNGIEAEGTLKKFDALAGSLRDSLNVSAGEARETMAYLINTGFKTDEVEDMTKAAYGLAYVMHEDVQSAVGDLEKAMTGQFAMLERKMPALKRLQTDEEKWAFLMKVSSNGLKEQGELQNTAAGKMRTMHTAVDQMSKSLGEFFAPAIAKAAEAVTWLAHSFTSGTREALGLEKHLQEFALWAPKLFGDERATALGEARIKQIDALIAAMDKAGKAPPELAAKNSLALNKMKDDTKAAFTKIEDVWKDYQKQLLEGEGFAKGKGKGKKGGPGVVGAGGIVGGFDPAMIAATIAENERANGNASGTLTAMDGRAEARARLKANRDFWDDVRSDPKNFEAVARGRFGGKHADYDEFRRTTDEDIAEFGSVAKADRDRMLVKAKADYLARGKASPKATLEDLMDATLSGAEAGGGGSFNAQGNDLRYRRQVDNINSFFDPKIAKEQAELAAPVDVVTTALKAVAQSIFGGGDGKPVRVKSDVDDQLLQAVRQLNIILPTVGAVR